MIIRYLGFREITRLAKVCRYFHDLVRQTPPCRLPALVDHRC
ncbi:F-box-like domain-containing protein [Endozoicomonas sp. ALD040]